MKELLDGLEFCKENNIYDTHINIALGINKVALSFREGFNQIKMENEKSNSWSRFKNKERAKEYR